MVTLQQHIKIVNLKGWAVLATMDNMRSSGNNGQSQCHRKQMGQKTAHKQAFKNLTPLVLTMLACHFGYTYSGILSLGWIPINILRHSIENAIFSVPKWLQSPLHYRPCKHNTLTCLRIWCAAPNALVWCIQNITAMVFTLFANNCCCTTILHKTQMMKIFDVCARPPASLIRCSVLYRYGQNMTVSAFPISSLIHCTTTAKDSSQLYFPPSQFCKGKNVEKHLINPHLPWPHVLCIFIERERLFDPDVFVAVIVIKLLDAVIACLVEHCAVGLLKQHRTSVISNV